MNEKNGRRRSPDRKPLSEEIGTSEQRKIRARKQAIRSIWSGFAMFGIIGWSIVIPTLLGVMAGLWFDSHYPSPERSWTLMLIVVGLIAGCLNAWHWIAEENRNMHKED
jgi:ATP synthase protein I